MGIFEKIYNKKKERKKTLLKINVVNQNFKK